MKRRDLMRSLLTLTAGVAAVPLSSLLEARIGRPLTPVSVAGVNRRVRRRTRRRVYRNMMLYSVPYGCSTRVMRAGVNYYYCGGIYYRPSYQGTTVVYIVDDIDPGANVNLDVEVYE